MPFIIAVVVAILVAFWAIGTFNRLIGLRNQTQNGWRQIDVQLKRRHDLIANNLGFAAAELYQITAAAERAMPGVDLGMKPPA